MARVSSLDVIRELKDQQKREREAQREQISDKEPGTSGSGWKWASKGDRKRDREALREAQREQISDKEPGTSGSGWKWASKGDRKRDREALREAQRVQDKLNQELTKKARVSVARKTALFDAKTLSQMEAATLLDCVIGQWQREK